MSDPDNQIFDAIISGNLQKLKKIIKLWIDLNKAYPYGETPLHCATKQGNLTIIKYLVENGANPNRMNDYGEKPITIAFYQARSDIFEYLSKNGSKLDGFLGKIALFSALVLKPKIDHSGVLKYLIENGAPSNRAVLSQFVIAHREDAMKMLIAAMLRADPNRPKPLCIQYRAADLSDFWDSHKAEIEVLRKVTFPNNLSLWNIVQETNENKLAKIYKNEQVQEELIASNFLEKYHYYGAKILKNLQRGQAKILAEKNAINTLFYRNTNSQLNEYCWDKILKMLPKESLVNITKVAYTMQTSSQGR